MKAPEVPVVSVPALAIGALLAAPLVVVHRHIPESLPVLGAVGLAIGWVGWIAASPRRARSMAGVWTIVFVLGASAFAATQHQRIVDERGRSTALRRTRLEDERWSTGVLFRAAGVRARAGDPLGLESLAAAVRDRSPGWIDADGILRRLGFESPPPPDPGWPPREDPLASPGSITDYFASGGTLGRILARDAEADRYEAELRAWHRARRAALDFAARPPWFDGHRWRPEGAGEVGEVASDRWPGSTFPWITIARGPHQAVLGDWEVRLRRVAPLEHALVVAEIEPGSAEAVALLSELRDVADPATAALAAFHLAAHRPPSWREVDAVKLWSRSRPEVPMPDEGAPEWIAIASVAIETHLDAAELDEVTPELDERLRTSLKAVEGVIAAWRTTVASTARPETALLHELALYLAARLADEDATGLHAAALEAIRPRPEAIDRARVILADEQVRRWTRPSTATRPR